MDSNTVRILSLDGGGIRGYLQLKFLQRIIADWGIREEDLWKYFDIIAGSSVGGLQALAYANGKTLTELETFFLEKAKRIFTIRKVPIGCDADSNSNRPADYQKYLMIAKNDPFYKSACSPDDGNSNYGSNVLYSTVRGVFGESKLEDLSTNVLVTSYEKDTDSFVLFSNYKHSGFRNDVKLSDVALATSAAPVYLPAYSFDDHTYIDGGVFQNNPSQLALTMGSLIKPCANRFCVMSLGTGTTGFGFDAFETDTVVYETDGRQLLEVPFKEGIVNMGEMLNAASGGSQEAVHFNLQMRERFRFDQFFYYRFQPKLVDENGDTLKSTELDNSTPEFLEDLLGVANRTYEKDKNIIKGFLEHLTL